MKYALSILMLIALTGCESHLSPRETRTQNYSAFIFSLYDNPKPIAPSTPPTVPMKVAVAQVGEIAPPQLMLDRLRQRGGMAVALGQHEIRFRHPSLGEQVRQVVVSAAEPARVSVNMKP